MLYFMCFVTCLLCSGMGFMACVGACGVGVSKGGQWSCTPYCGWLQSSILDIVFSSVWNETPLIAAQSIEERMQATMLARHLALMNTRPASCRALNDSNIANVLLRQDGPPPSTSTPEHSLPRLRTDGSSLIHSSPGWRCCMRRGHSGCPAQVVHRALRHWQLPAREQQVPAQVRLSGPISFAPFMGCSFSPIGKLTLGALPLENHMSPEPGSNYSPMVS